MKQQFRQIAGIMLLLALLAACSGTNPELVNSDLTAETAETTAAAAPEIRETPTTETVVLEPSAQEAEPGLAPGVPDEQFMEAVEAGDAAEVERLLEAGANPDAEDGRGNAVLAMAARHGELKISQLLLDAGANVNSTGRARVENKPAITLAARYNHLPVVELLIAHGAEIDQPDTDWGGTALGEAAFRNHAEIVRLLLENGADPNYRSDLNAGETPLHWAAMNGAADAAEVLLEFGVDVDIQTGWGKTPLMIAVSSSSSSIVPFLIDHGADPNIQDKFGNTALHLVTENDTSDVIEILLEGGAQIDAQNDLGETTLHRAAQYYAMRTLEVLIDQGAALDIKNKEGQTALDVAANEKIKEILREAEAVEGSQAGEATCSDKEEPCLTVSFDGTNCMVTGPIDNHAGNLTLIFSNLSEGAAKVEAARLRDDKTIEDLAEDTRNRPQGYAPDWVSALGFWGRAIDPGATSPFKAFALAGDYGILCFKVPQYAIFGDGFTLIDTNSN